MIAPALAALAAYPQFILWRLEPSRTRPGKTDKYPLDWRSMAVANAHDPAIWLDYPTAEYLASVAGPRHGVGFVFTRDDPFWFLDIDECLTPAGWSPTAAELCQQLRGAAVEVSQSGRGLHLFGTGTIPPHGCKNAAAGLELYHEGRFVALGTGAQGDAGHNCTAGLAAVVSRYFPAGSGSSPTPADWTDGPCEGAAAANVDDSTLIARACSGNGGAGAAFGHKATFAALWTADAAALGAAFPDPAREYDASGADSALAMRLMYWTGRDCERTDRLMRASGLAREKYERDDYLPRTISGALARHDPANIWKGRPVDSAVTVAPAPSGGPTAPARSLATARPVDGATILGVDEQIALFAGHTYVRECHMVACPDGMLASRERFDSWLGGWQFVMDRENSKLSSSAWDAFTGSRLYRFPKVHRTAFRPALPPGAIWESGGQDYVNIYSPVVTARAAGDPAPFLDLLKRILPVKIDRDILLAYMAFCCQYPGVKAQWAVLIQGVQGNGKSFIGECLIEAVGRRYCHSPKAGELTGKFNSWVYGILLAIVEDMYTPSRQSEVLEVLKPMITSAYLEIEPKGQDKRSAEICCNFLLNSNHKDAIRKTKDDRRFAVFYCAQQEEADLARDGMAGDYFPKLYDWARTGGWAIVNDFLRSYQIPDALNPARACHRAPVTSSTAEACRASAGPIEQEIQDAIEAGRVGFRGGWVSSHYLDALLREVGAERILPRNKRRELLTTMGYVPHPGLAETDGRANNVVAPEGVRSRLYVLRGHDSEALRGQATVARAYTAAQAEEGASGPAAASGPVLAFKKNPAG